jgi:hypothetical protein
LVPAVYTLLLTSLRVSSVYRHRISLLHFTGV